MLASHARGCRAPAPAFALTLALGLMFPVALLLAPVALAAPSVAPPTDVVHAATPEDIVRSWVAAVNQGDADTAIGLYADDAVIEALGQQIRGKAAIARRQRTVIAPVLRPRIEIEQLAVEGEAVTARFAGENAITRFDGRGPVHATTTF
jgi:ketosteroid isomerase-like protein